MNAASRTKTLELHEHTAVQRLTFLALVAVCIVTLFVYVAAPAMDAFFDGFLRMETVKDGKIAVYTIGENRTDTATTSLTGVWALIDFKEKAKPAGTPVPGKVDVFPAAYVFKPVIALFPLVVVGGFVIAALLTMMIPGGYVRQKIQRELLTVLDRLAYNQYGEHTQGEIKRLISAITSADIRKLHDLAEEYNMDYLDLELLRNALKWHEANGFLKLMYSHDALKFYMREYFTDRYSNTILGAVYIGAAILIIVIGIRGLKFLPATDPSMVLGALGLEFMLLITYAIVLMYGKSEESTAMVDKKLPSSVVHGDAGSIDEESLALLRAFLSVDRSTRDSGTKQ